jgi:hypothetical protein
MQELVSGIGNLTSTRALAASALLLNTVSGSATAGQLTPQLSSKVHRASTNAHQASQRLTDSCLYVLHQQALSALSSVAERVAEQSNKWTGKEQDKIQDTLLPSVMRVIIPEAQRCTVSLTGSGSELACFCCLHRECRCSSRVVC